MKPLVIGSYALAWQLDKLGIRHDLNPNDLDIIVRDSSDCDDFITKLEEGEGKATLIKTVISEKFSTVTKCVKVNTGIVEITYPTSDTCTTATLLDKSVLFPESMPCIVECSVAPIELLYSLKMSHRYLKNSPHFLKTLKAAKILRKLTSDTHYDVDWYNARVKETYNYAHPKLSVNKSEFFNSNFNYIYDHDTIHEAVKLLDKPAYTFYMDGDAEVNCSKEKFFACERVIRLLGVLEETYVLALERSQIPNEFNINPRKSFNIALEKVCTSITSGWFREYAWDHYEQISAMYDSGYVDKFKLALSQGIVKPFNNPSMK